MASSFWKKPPRLLESFGVSGVLVDGCTVFHENLYSCRHVGRVSDLIMAALHGAGVAGTGSLHELRVRTVILMGFFEAFLGQSQVTPPNEATGALNGPLGVECGVDSEKVAIGISFAMPEGADFKQFSGFESLLNQLHASSDHLVFRVHAKTLRAELVALVAIPGKMELGELEPVEMVTIGGDTVPEAPAADYVELGDVSYAELLKSDEPDAALIESAPSRAEELVKIGATPAEREEAIRVSGAQAAEDETQTRVKGTKEAADDFEKRFGADAADANTESKRTVKGGSPAEDESVLRIKGDSSLEAGDDGIMRIKSGGDSLKREGREWGVGGGQGLPADADEESADPSIRISARSAQDSAEEEEVVRIPGEAEEEYVERKRITRLKRKAASGAADETSEDLSGDGESPLPTIKPGRANEAAAELAQEAEGLEKELSEGRLEEIVRKRKGEMAEAMSDPTKAKRWVEGLMSEVVQEKARLSELARKLNLSFRQKEIEFRTMENTLQEQLRRKDEFLKQKIAALSHSKEQIAQMNLVMERLKAKGSSNSMSSSSSDKSKIDLMNKSLTAQREENTKLLSRVEELRNQLAAAQLAKKVGSSGSAESKELQEKNTLLAKKLDETKRQMLELTEKLAEAKKSQSAAVKDDGGLKSKLEAATKQAATHQKEAEKLQQKLQELQKEQIAAKYELAKLQAEIKQLKAGAAAAAATAAKASAAGAAKAPAAAAAKPAAKPGGKAA